MPRSPMISLVHDADRSAGSKSADGGTTPRGDTGQTAPTTAEAETPVKPTGEAPPPLAPPLATEPTSMPEAATPAEVQTAIPEAQPATAQTAPEPAPAPRPPVLTAGQPFIPPRPATPAAQEPHRHAPQAAPNAFAEAAIENGAAHTEKRRGRSLFQKVTGAVNSLVTDEEPSSARTAPARDAAPLKAPTQAPSFTAPAPQPAASTAPAVAPAPISHEKAPETTAGISAEIPPETAPPTPTQPSLTNLEPAARTEAASGDEDMLEIPAFLRRQAN